MYRHVKKARPNPVLNFRHCIFELLCDGLALQRVDGVRMCLSRRDDERNDGNR